MNILSSFLGFSKEPNVKSSNVNNIPNPPENKLPSPKNLAIDPLSYLAEDLHASTVFNQLIERPILAMTKTKPPAFVEKVGRVVDQTDIFLKKMNRVAEVNVYSNKTLVDLLQLINNLDSLESFQGGISHIYSCSPLIQVSPEKEEIVREALISLKNEIEAVNTSPENYNWKKLSFLHAMTLFSAPNLNPNIKAQIAEVAKQKLIESKNDSKEMENVFIGLVHGVLKLAPLQSYEQLLQILRNLPHPALVQAMCLADLPNDGNLSSKDFQNAIKETFDSKNLDYKKKAAQSLEFYLEDGKGRKHRRYEWPALMNALGKELISHIISFK